MMTNYIVAHKAFPIPNVPTYRPIQVGFGAGLGGLRDNTQDSIADKNGSFCELTALYWIWKNDKTSDIVGLHHYRRYFTTTAHPRSYADLIRPEEIESLLQEWDWIAARFEPYKETVYEQYCAESGFAKDLDALRALIAKQTPDYLPAFDTIMAQGGICQYNMSIAPKPLLDAYCSWLFPLLLEMEKNTDLHDYNDYQKRIYGFLGERLLNVWLLHNQIKVKQLPVYAAETTKKEQRRLRLRRLRNRIQFFLVHHRPNETRSTAGKPARPN